MVSKTNTTPRGPREDEMDRCSQTQMSESNNLGNVTIGNVTMLNQTESLEHPFQSVKNINESSSLTSHRPSSSNTHFVANSLAVIN
jgi:hypothetical protein